MVYERDFTDARRDYFYNPCNPWLKRGVQGESPLIISIKSKVQAVKEKLFLR
jgi:hypothetical protein